MSRQPVIVADAWKHYAELATDPEIKRMFEDCVRIDRMTVAHTDHWSTVAMMAFVGFCYAQQAPRVLTDSVAHNLRLRIERDLYPEAES